MCNGVFSKTRASDPYSDEESADMDAINTHITKTNYFMKKRTGKQAMVSQDYCNDIAIAQSGESYM